MAEKVVDDFTKKPGDFELVEIITVTNLKQMEYHLEVLTSIKRLDAVVVGGGDGTIVSVLNAMEGRDVIFGFLPLGTSNTFVRSLGLPNTYPAAKKLVMKGDVRKASLGAVNGKLFANIAGIGLPATVSERTTNKAKKLLGPFVYIVDGVRALTREQAFFCHVVNDDTNEGFYTHYLLFANGKYHGTIPLGKDVSAYNDKLVLLAFGVSDKRRHTARALLRLIVGRHRSDRQIKAIPFERLLVTTKPSRSIEADGEIIGRTPATVEIRKDAIKVFSKPSR